MNAVYSIILYLLALLFIFSSIIGIVIYIIFYILFIYTKPDQKKSLNKKQYKNTKGGNRKC